MPRTGVTLLFRTVPTWPGLSWLVLQFRIEQGTNYLGKMLWGPWSLNFCEMASAWSKQTKIHTREQCSPVRLIQLSSTSMFTKRTFLFLCVVANYKGDVERWGGVWEGQSHTMLSSIVWIHQWITATLPYVYNSALLTTHSPLILLLILLLSLLPTTCHYLSLLCQLIHILPWLVLQWLCCATYLSQYLLFIG